MGTSSANVAPLSTSPSHITPNIATGTSPGDAVFSDVANTERRGGDTNALNSEQLLPSSPSLLPAAPELVDPVNGLPVTTLSASEPPLAAGFAASDSTPATSPVGGSWALINLLFVVFSLLWSAALLPALIKGRGREREERGRVTSRKRRGNLGARIVVIAIGAVALLVFVCTENLTSTMSWVDSWSPLMAVFLIIQDIVTINMSAPEDEAEEAPAPAASYSGTVSARVVSAKDASGSGAAPSPSVSLPAVSAPNPFLSPRLHT
ncbi:MAG: hypothetical protein LBH56_00295 [Coriobacteriales bacterium]|nr:hypothetical protein [Coriobacteriales bacterium]